MDEFLSSLLNFDPVGWFQSLLDTAGQNPFLAMWFFIAKGGWIFFLWFFWWTGTHTWREYRRTKFWHKKEWMLMRITVPRTTEQTCRAVENIFATFAGIHNNPSWTETWIDGFVQPTITLEIASIDGIVSYYIWCERRFRNLCESAIYAQYPDADMIEVENYAKQVPQKYPDEEWDGWGTEMMQLMPDPYPLRTYVEFEDKISGELKDPLANLLENFAHLGPGEQAWYQIILTPTNQKEEKERAEKIINKIKGVEEKHKETMLDHLLKLPLMVLQELSKVVFGAGEEEHKKENKREDFPKTMRLSPGEKNILEALERKASKIGFRTKIRYLYLAKTHLYKKPRAVHPFVGAMKQFNTFDMQALKPESKVAGLSSTIWWFKNGRNWWRLTKLVRRYAKRSNDGIERYFMSSEELATLWHFPILLQVKAPALQRTEAKKTDAPSNIPFG